MERLGKFYDFLLCAFANTLAANHGIKTRFSPWWSIPDDLLQVSEHQPVLLVRGTTPAKRTWQCTWRRKQNTPRESFLKTPTTSSETTSSE